MKRACIFCSVIQGTVPSRMIRKTSKWAAFYDIAPKAPKHILIVPVRHIESLLTVKPSNQGILGQLLLAANEIAKDLNLDGYKIVINNGVSAGQIVPHLHLHLLGGWSQTPSFPV